MKLTVAPPGVPLIITTIEHITNAEKTQLSSLGLVQGSSIQIITRDHSNLILNVKNSRIGIEKALAKRISVDL